MWLYAPHVRASADAVTAVLFFFTPLYIIFGNFNFCMIHFTIDVMQFIFLPKSNRSIQQVKGHAGAYYKKLKNKDYDKDSDDIKSRYKVIAMLIIFLTSFTGASTYFSTHLSFYCFCWRLIYT